MTIKRFNRAEFETLRGLLEDIAKETGGRAQRMDATVKHEGEVKQAVTIYLPANGRDRAD